MSKWRWMPVKQIGARPTARSGISCAAIPNTNKILFFGGVQDNENIDDEDSDSDDEYVPPRRQTREEIFGVGVMAREATMAGCFPEQ